MQTHPDVVFDIVTSRHEVARIKNQHRHTN
jgi:hypothetical protein